MKEYDITITETLEKAVSVTANSQEEAEEQVRQGYYNSEYVLDADNFTQVDFKTSEGREPAREDNTIEVLLVKPSEFPQPYQISTELEALQAAVGGDIQVLYPYDDPVGLVCNEEAKLTGLPLNRALRDESGQMYDIIAGDFLVIGLTEDDFSSLTPEQMEKYEKLFHSPEAFLKMAHRVIVLPMDDETVKNAAKDKANDSLKRTQPDRAVL
ncbi:MAG: DUF3846 domain-containing protein [Oscillospiraceae bacterium]|nr:DUF3846 domain-containing protein [Oscillospiraceae bacterium]